MAGNSKRRGAIRKKSSGNPTAGSGGRRRRGLEGKGPTPKAEDRPPHKAYRRAQAAQRAAERSGGGSRGGARSRDGGDKAEWIVGRNPVVEALRAGAPIRTLHIADRIERDDRVREALRLATAARIPLSEVPRSELDRLTSGAVHQGIAIQIPPYDYADPSSLLDTGSRGSTLIVALDGVTDPRNLGAVVRSCAAFGASGVVVPERRSASMSAAAWKTSAGAALRVPVARAVNLTRCLKAYQEAGLMVVGLDASPESSPLSSISALTDPVVLVAGAEGRGLSRLVRETCDFLGRIPIDSATESLNASVAVGIALYETARAREG